MKSKALAKRETLKVRTIKDLLVKHGNHMSDKLPTKMKLGGNAHSRSFQDILDDNCLATSLLYLRNAINDMNDFGKHLNIPTIQRDILKIMILSLIVNEHLERGCHLIEHDC